MDEIANDEVITIPKLERDPETGRITKGVAQDTNKNGTVGRPTVVTEDVLRKLAYVFGLGGSIREACYFANIGETTYYEYVKNNPEKQEYFTMLKEKPILKARTELIKGLEGNPDLALRFLERKRKEEFSIRTENVNTNITVDDLLAKFENPDDNEIADTVLHKEQTGEES